MYDLARTDLNLAANSDCQFLRIRGLLVEPDLHGEADQVEFEVALAALLEPVASEDGVLTGPLTDGVPRPV
ncbi:hypothetical protein [Streptomyces sp. NBC_00467]|uniref:hypothetical protein n=1 Tax=Streptomyces sp. NBC_00467 TaxID=2975752 RepID=UPI002E18BBB9